MNSEHVSLIFRLVQACIVLVMGYVLAFISRVGLQRVTKPIKGDKTLFIFISHIVFWMVFVAAIISAINMSGFYTTSFLTVFSAAFAALIISLQKSLSNVASGVLVLFQRPFRLGDVIEVKGVKGKVIEMNAFMTKIEVEEGVTVIPNGILLDNPINVVKATPIK